MARACDRCKTKKIKCDGTRPCLQCSKILADCVYNSSVAPRPEELSSRLSVLNRVRKLETQLGGKEPPAKRAQRVDNHFLSWYNESYAAARLAEAPSAMSNKFRYGRRYTTLLPSIFASSLVKNIPTSVRAANQISVPRLQGYGWNMSGVHYLPLFPPMVELPPKEELLTPSLASELLEYYFDHVNPLYAILHKSMFLTQYRSYTAAKDKSEHTLFTALLYIACATAMRYSEINHFKAYEPGLEENLFCVGQRIFETFTFQWESVELVQGWLLVAFYLRTAHRQSSVWCAIGQAVLLAKGMGLMKHSWFEQVCTKYDVVKVKHVFWSLFTMERFLCLDFGRVFSFNIEDITLGIPESFEDDGWWTPYSFALCKLAIALQPLDRDFNNGLDEDELLEVHMSVVGWNEAIAKPMNLTEDDIKGPDAAIIAHIRLQYNDCLLYIHSRSVYPLVDSTQMTYIPSSWQMVLSCARSSVQINLTLRDCNQLCTCWWLRLGSLFSAGLLLLVFLNADIQAESVREPITEAFGLIEALVADGRFKMSDECLWALEMLRKMVVLRMQQNISFLGTIEKEQSPKGVAVNRRNFGSMGIFDETGRVLSPHASVIHGTASFKGTNENLTTALTNSIDWFNSWEWDPEAAVASFLEY